ncbi:MAG: alpha/beta hydrolase [Alphaproteobacteria bacterium]|nr:alpha/beta hydrolase [Alphaproteobacteria bacterium]MBV9693161.1 alpha/beta hydrolase [Alphaproteobacteria bacterium]
MPLDPVLKAFLDQMGQVPGPKLFELPPADGRAMFVAMMQMIGPKDVPIGSVKELRAGSVALRMYTPVDPGRTPPGALVYFHGGGFVIGDLETHDAICRQFANDGGFAVIAVDYRLAPEHKFPAAVDDALSAIDWIAAHAGEIGIDAGRIAVGGDSAGGALAAVVAQQAKLRGHPRIAFQMLLFPVTQIGEHTASRKEFATGYFLDGESLDWFFAHYLPSSPDLRDARISPLHAADFRGLPPAYVMLGGFDPLHDEGLAYARKLQDAGVAVEIADYSDHVHCFIYMQAVLPQARAAVTAAAKAVAKGLEAR